MDSKSYRDFSDEGLMRELQQGKSVAMDEIYDRYGRRLLYYFFRMLGGDEDKAQDFVQDLFIKIFEKAAVFDTEKKFSTWIFTIASNMCKNEYRRLAVRQSFADDFHERLLTSPPEENEQWVAHRLDRRNFEESLQAELRMMDEEERNLFILRFQENFPVKEIARMLQRREGTVKSRLFNLCRKLALRLQDYCPVDNERKNI